MPRRSRSTETTNRFVDILRTVQQQGFDVAKERFALGEDALLAILRDGLSPEQFETLTATREQRENVPDSGLQVPLPGGFNEIFDSTLGPRDRLQDIIRAGGQTDETREISDRALDIGAGRIPSQVQRDAVSAEILANRGETERTRLGTDRVTDILNSFGQVGLNEASDALRTAGDAVSTGGVTGNIQSAVDVALQLIQERGFNQDTSGIIDLLFSPQGSSFTKPVEFDQAFANAQNLASGGGSSSLALPASEVLPLDEAIRLAEGTAADATQSSLRGAARLNAQRGGGPGASVIGQDQRESTLAVAEAQARATAETRRENQLLRVAERQDNVAALTQSRGDDLRLQATGINAEASLAGTLLNAQTDTNISDRRLASELFGERIRADTAQTRTGADLLASSNVTAADNFRTGLAGVADITRIFTDRETQAFDTLLGIERSVGANIALGADIAAGTQRERLAGLGTALGVEQLTTARSFDALSGLNALNSNELNARLQNQGQRFNFQSNANDDILELLRLSAGIEQSGQDNSLRAIELLLASANPFLDIANTATAGLGPLGANLAQIQGQPGLLQTFLGSFGEGFGQGIGQGAGSGIASGIGGLFGD